MTDLSTARYLKRRRTREQWFELIVGFDASDLDVPKYCDLHAVSQASFYRWRALLGQDSSVRASKADRQTPALDGFVDIGTVQTKPVVSPGEQPSCARRVECRLELGAGLVLTISHG